MSKLPKIETPVFELELPSSGQKVKYRTFTVKEEKILLIAQESKDIDQIILSIKQIVNNCLIDKTVDELAMFDLEYLLLNIRAKSVDNIVKFSVNPEGEKINIELDLNEIKIKIPENHSKEIRLNDEYVLYMRYPTINEFLLMLKNTSNAEVNYKIMISCMDMLVGEDSVYKFSEFTPEEIDEFVDSFSNKNITDIKTFFETMPKLRHEAKYLDKEGKERLFVLEGLETFFI